MRESGKPICEPFAIFACAPMRVRCDLDSFAAEGGEPHRNRDGWGMIIGEERDAHCLGEATAVADSPLDRFVRTHATPHAIVMAHVRRASTGDRSLANTHPFRRIRSGRLYHFAHNGTLKGIEEYAEAQPLLSHRIGDTDRELALLVLRDRPERAAPNRLDVAARFKVFRTFAGGMADLGPANLMWLDGL